MKNAPCRTATFLLPLLLGAEAVAQCHYIPSTATNNDTVIFASFGGGYGSYGCAPVDPTYWLAGSGAGVYAGFVQPQSFPAIRVWGMNDDDTASVMVNGAAYHMDNTSATLYPKVVCGQSPGPDGVLFSNGNLVGANSGVEGNYSYQDILLNVVDVTNVTVMSMSGAGWGFAGVVLDCAAAVPEQHAEAFAPFPNPTHGLLTIGDGAVLSEVVVLDAVGAQVRHVTGRLSRLDLSDLAPGIYGVVITRNGRRTTHRVLRD